MKDIFSRDLEPLTWQGKEHYGDIDKAANRMPFSIKLCSNSLNILVMHLPPLGMKKKTPRSFNFNACNLAEDSVR